MTSNHLNRQWKVVALHKKKKKKKRLSKQEKVPEDFLKRFNVCIKSRTKPSHIATPSY